MTTEIDKKTLANLRDYFLKGGSTETDDILKFLETNNEAVMNDYIAELKTTYPDDFGPKKKKAKAPEDEPEQRFFLKDALTGLVTELEVSKQKPGKTTLVVKEPKELVKIILHGDITTIDLYQLNKLPDTAIYAGESVAKLKQLAELAKA